MIEHAERLTRIFGKWPSFHDAEVVRVSLDRTGPDGPNVETQIHVFETTSEVDATGYYVRKNHTLVTLAFTGVLVEELGGFNEQNVLFDLKIAEIDPTKHEGRRLRVTLEPSYGVAGSFMCRRASVRDVEPYAAAA